MKIVQSLWSKPGQKKAKEGFAGQNKCGWPDKKYNYFSWALSVLQFRKYYDEVELVTDEAGRDLLVGKLALPYTSVRVELDRLNHYHPDLWAIGKIYAYSIQQEPFIHADGDVYVWERFDEDFMHSPLLCQHREEGVSYERFYQRSFTEMMKNLPFIPEVLHRSVDKNKRIRALNAGILGGVNLEFYREYCERVFNFVDKNVSRLGTINVGVANVIFEQFMFYAIAEEKQTPIRYLKDDPDFMWHTCTDFTGVPAQSTYIHTPGSLKKDRTIGGMLEQRLLLDHPDHYYRILHLLRTNQI